MADIAHYITLEVPEGVNYDLSVYKAGSMYAHETSTNPGFGANERLVVVNPDQAMSNESFEYYIYVEYVSGSSCDPWKLQFLGKDCNY